MSAGPTAVTATAPVPYPTITAAVETAAINRIAVAALVKALTVLIFLAPFDMVARFAHCEVLVCDVQSARMRSQDTSAE